MRDAIEQKKGQEEEVEEREKKLEEEGNLKRRHLNNF